MKITKLTRIKDDGYQTLGELKIMDGCQQVFECVTLELPYLDNQTRVSCIPDGKYKCTPRTSTKYKNHYLVNDVPNRDFILIHWGNYKRDTEGCILLGEEIKDINTDEHKDITNSKNTFNEFMAVMDGEVFELEISYK